jgi:hypothetical protein
MASTDDRTVATIDATAAPRGDGGAAVDRGAQVLARTSDASGKRV